MTRLIDWELPALCAITPVLLFPTPDRLWALGLLPLLWWSAWRRSGRPVPRTPLNPAIWGILLMAAVSVAVTPDLRLSLGKLCGLLLGVLWFWAAVRWTSSPVRLAHATTIFVCAGVVLAVLGLFGTRWIPKFPALWPVIQALPGVIRGVPGAEAGFNPNAVSGALVLFLPVQLALLVSRQARGPRGLSRAVWHGLGLLVTTGAMVLLQSLAAWAALAVAAVASLLWHSRRSRVLAGALLIVLSVLVLRDGPGPFFNETFSRSGAHGGTSLAIRQRIWDGALAAIADHPVVGMGMGMFRHVAPVRYPEVLTPPARGLAHAHNQFLQTALDLGLPGLLAYLLLLWLTARTLVRAARHSADARALAGGLGAGLIAHLVFGLVDAIPLGSKVGVLFWLTLALTVGLARVHGGTYEKLNRTAKMKLP